MKANDPVAAVAAAADHLEVRPSMESFQFLDPAPAAASIDHRRRDRELLQRKVEEVERLYAAYKLARGNFVGELEFDGDLLLKMVDDLERNMKLSRSPESERGRWYREYSARREVKLREELGLKGAQKRTKMKVIAEKFEESWEEMMAKNCREGGSAIKGREQQNKEEEQEEEETREEAANTQQKPSAKHPLISDDPTKSPINVPVKISSSPDLPILKPPKNPNPTRRTTQPNRSPVSHSLPDSSYLRKENMKPPPTKLNKADAPLRSTKPCARRKSTVSLGELKDFSSMNSYCSSSPARKTMESSKSSKALGKKKDGDGSNTVKMRGFETTQGWIEERSSNFHIEMDNAEPRTSREILKSEAKNVESPHADRELVNHPQQSVMQADPPGAARARKKWGTAEKPSVATSSSPDNLLKDAAKQFKRLIRFGKKRKNGGGSAAVLTASSSSDSRGDGDDETERGGEMTKGSPEDLKKSRSDYSIPAYVGLYKGKIFQERVQSPSYWCPASPANIKLRRDHQLEEGFPKGSCSLFSFLSFHGRGREGEPRSK